MNKIFVALSAISLAFYSCHDNSTKHDPSTLDSTAINAINADTYKAYVERLSSDEFLGRQPFTKGDSLTVDYIKEQFIALGLEPGNGESFFQKVPMHEITTKPTANQLTFKSKTGKITKNYLDDYVIVSRKSNETIDIKSTELVFAGFGIVAPEYNWNDYKDLDVKGKTVVVMVSDPGRYDKNLFKADTMTYYGRWDYKYEEAARQGATGILLIHETAAASYGWGVVRGGWSSPQLVLASKSDEQVPTFEGWITTETAKDLFKIAGLNSNLLEEAKKPNFKAIPMGITTDVNLKNTFRKSESSNVVAKIAGTKRATETIIYTAHWDHLGIGEAVNGDSIYNGAIDNAAGVAALFEIAKAFKSAKQKPERTIVFMALTAEEEGLLGSEYYANNPLFPINKTVANLNMDAFSALGATKDVSIVGYGQSELEDYVTKSAKKFDRVVKGEKNPGSGGFYRSDHFNFVKKGIPGLYMGSGSELISQDTVAISVRRKALSGKYHTPLDQVNEHWDFNGIIADIRLYFDIGYMMSLENTFPQFKTKSEFREIGEKRLSK